MPDRLDHKYLKALRHFWDFRAGIEKRIERVIWREGWRHYMETQPDMAVRWLDNPLQIHGITVLSSDHVPDGEIHVMTKNTEGNIDSRPLTRNIRREQPEGARTIVPAGNYQYKVGMGNFKFRGNDG